MSGLEVLFLNLSDVQSILSMEDALKAVEEAFREKGLGRVQMPPKLYVYFPRYGGDFRVMPAYLEKTGVAGVKTVNVHPKNPKLYGLRTVMAIIELLDPKTGAPLCIMDGSWLTAMRTGAAGGVAAKYLARRDSRVVGLVGAGVQARTQLEALNLVLNSIERVKVFDIVEEAVLRYAGEMSKRLGLDVEPVSSVEEAVREADVVVSTTPSKSPVVMDEWIGEGVHINAIGADAPGKQELDPKILRRAKIVVDDMEQAVHSGEVNVPISQGLLSTSDIYAEIGDIVAGRKPGRVSSYEITVFDSTGLAIQDIAVAWTVYRRALESGVGLRLKLI